MEIARGTFDKLDDEQRIAFGWAYVAKKGDALVIDHSGDFVDESSLPDLEKSVYDFMLISREADDMHVRTEGIGKVVESVFLTSEKMDAMGISGERIGWWVGMKIEDADVWQKIKSGDRKMFSIRGNGIREDTHAAAA